ncbi:TIGR04540 family protein [Bacillaceae bacterium Marseille-Q3522]|nr:TIGR04540 family protein [Bacillaceae bacterium Marseille-Q3522]
MELKLFYRTQRDLAAALNNLVDAYWEEKIEEHDLIEGVQNIHKNNMDKLIKNNGFTAIIQQQCGKRRLAVIGRILDME